MKERSALSGPASDHPPRGAEHARRREELDQVGDDERRQPEGDRGREIDVERECQPRHAERLDHDVAEEHRSDGAKQLAIPAELGEPARDGCSGEEADQIAGGGTEDEGAGQRVTRDERVDA